MAHHETGFCPSYPPHPTAPSPRPHRRMPPSGETETPIRVTQAVPLASPETAPEEE